MRRVPAPATVSERFMLMRSTVPNAIAPGSLNYVGNVGRVLMLPSPDDDPSCLAQTLIRPAVTGDVGVKLGPPPVGVRLGSHGVLGTAVPEAAVDEDGDPSAGEGDVGPARDGRHVDAIAETPSMQLAPEGTLGLGPRGPQGRHEAADDGTRRRGFVRNG